MKINNFRGDLTDISAKKEALITARWFDAHGYQPEYADAWLYPSGECRCMCTELLGDTSALHLSGKYMESGECSPHFRCRQIAFTTVHCIMAIITALYNFHHVFAHWICLALLYLKRMLAAETTLASLSCHHETSYLWSHSRTKFCCLESPRFLAHRGLASHSGVACSIHTLDLCTDTCM